MRDADVQGQPQCLGKEIIIGFPSLFGTSSLGDEGALEPTSGTGHICRVGCLLQELSSCNKVMMVPLEFCTWNADHRSWLLLEQSL